MTIDKNTLLMALFCVTILLLGGCGSKQSNGKEIITNSNKTSHADEMTSHTGFPIIITNKTKEGDGIITASVVSNEYIGVQEKIELSLIYSKYEKGKIAQRTQKDANWPQELIRLKKLCEEYTNRWDEIPDESDRHQAAYIFGDSDSNMAYDVWHDLMENSEDLMIGCNAAEVLALVERQKGNIDGALQLFDKYEKRILGNNSLEDICDSISEEEREALNALYAYKSLALYFADRIDEHVETIKQSTLLAGNNLRYKAQGYSRLADAYAKLSDQENVIIYLEKARDSWLKISNKDKGETYPLFEDIIKRLDYAKKGKLPTTRFYGGY